MAYRAVAPPPMEHLLQSVTSAAPTVEPTALAHVIRGLLLLHTEHYDRSLADLRLAGLYDPASAFLQEKLATAFLATAHTDEAERILQQGLQLHPEDGGLNLLAGQLALESWHYDAAAGYLRYAMVEPERSVAAAAPYVDALLWLQRPKEAQASYKTVTEAFPSDADLAVSLGASFEDHELLDAARGAYRQARLLKPQDKTAVLSEVRVDLLLGEGAAAADALAPLLSFYPDATDLHVQLLNLLRPLARPVAAMRANLVKRSDGDVHTRLALAAGDWLGSAPRTAAALLHQTIGEVAQGDATDLRLLLAQIELQQGHFDSALDGLRLAGDSGPVWRTRARICAAQAHWDCVLASLQQAAVRSDDVAAVFQEGTCLLLHRFSAAVVRERMRALASALQPPLPPAVERLAQVAVADALGQGGAALELLHPWARVHLDDASLQLHYADLLARNGQVDHALSLLTHLVQQDPFDAKRLNALGFALVDANRRLPEAAVWIRRAFRLANEDPEVMDSLGWLLVRQGRLREATSWLQRAHIAAPADPEILRHLGDAMLQSHRVSEARQVYEEALQQAASLPLRRLLKARLATVGSPKS